VAKLPRDPSGWVAFLRKEWPHRALPADVSRGLAALVRQYQRADEAGRKRMRAAINEPVADRLWRRKERSGGKTGTSSPTAWPPWPSAVSGSTPATSSSRSA
jgi:hypothetical protein